ncbi:hypothetical protein ANCDUO_24480, partial [Ancylostoma duodenale]
MTKRMLISEPRLSVPNAIFGAFKVKIAKSDDDMEGGLAPTVQFRETNEYPVVFKWHCSAT